MDPLSSIRSLGIPAASPLALPKSGAERVGPGAIPFYELKELGGAGPAAAPAPVEGGFGSLLGGLVQEVNQKQNVATEAVKGLIGGENVSLHQAVIAMEEANVSFQLMVEVRNKVLDAYQELMRMQM